MVVGDGLIDRDSNVGGDGVCTWLWGVVVCMWFW